MKTIILTLSLLMGFSVVSQTTTYNDVAVIVNDNSQTSIDIGNYFQQARNIPSQNIIHVYAPVTEDIDSLEFQQVRAQIEDYLVTYNLVDSINYLVTTKGVPLKIEAGCVTNQSVPSSCASFDSEIALILGGYSNYIGQTGALQNPVFNSTSNFSRNSIGIYLVTRLDGYSKADVFDLIDNSAPFIGLNRLTAKAVVDISNSTGTDSAYFAAQFIPAYDYLINNSWNAELNVDFSPLINQDNVFGYLGVGHGPLPSTSINYEWTKGAIGTMAMCNSAFTFDVAANTANAFLIADLIADGCTGAHGHVDYIFFTQIMDAEILLNRYLDPIESYNLAESFYMAEHTLSWQTVIIGDPKASVVLDNLATIDKIDFDELSIYPNPSTGSIKVSGSELITSIVVFDMMGAQVKSLDELMSNSVELDLSEVRNGVYVVQVEIGGNVMRERVVINN